MASSDEVVGSRFTLGRELFCLQGGRASEDASVGARNDLSQTAGQLAY